MLLTLLIFVYIFLFSLLMFFFFFFFFFFSFFFFFFFFFLFFFFFFFFFFSFFFFFFFLFSLFFFFFFFFFFFSCYGDHRDLHSFPTRRSSDHHARVVLDQHPLNVGGHRLEAHIATPAFREQHLGDRKSTRLNSSHVEISYA